MVSPRQSELSQLGSTYHPQEDIDYKKVEGNDQEYSPCYHHKDSSRCDWLSLSDTVGPLWLHFQAGFNQQTNTP